jgi:predicted metal-dependent peptidase
MPEGEVLDHTKVAAARTFAAARMPYLASAMFAATVLPAPGSGTIAVDRRWRVLADPVVLSGLETQELGRLFVHLVSHLLRDHANRADVQGTPGLSRRPVEWNRAADAEVNDDLVPAGMVPRGAADLPENFGQAAGQLAERYYSVVPPGERQWDCGSGCDGVPRPWDPGVCDGRCGGRCHGDCAGTSERHAHSLRLAVASALQKAEGLEPGTVGAGWLRWAEQVLPSKVDWRRVLAAEVRQGVAHASGMVDYSYRRPSRRAEVAAEVVLPVLERPVPEVAVICDTSGSMSSEQLGQALVEVESLLQKVGLRGTQVRVLACDAEVQSVRRVSRASQVELLGGGGTDMGEGIAQALALKPRPSVVVVLTDGWTPWPPDRVGGANVVVGLIGPGGGSRLWGRSLAPQPPAPPSWMRSVHIDVG